MKKEAQAFWNTEKSKYELFYKNKVLARSRELPHFEYLINRKPTPKISAAGVTGFVVMSYGPNDEIKISPPASVAPTETPVAVAAPVVEEFTVSERFDLLEDLVRMVANGDAKSVLVSGEGGVGKTYTILKVLNEEGMVSHHELVPTYTPPISVEDDEGEMTEKAVAVMSKPKGDYIVVKGYATAKSLYRLMHDHRDGMLVFDDCDSVLRDQTAVMLLKSALDSYEKRIVSWYAEGRDQDLPSSFEFTGSIVFISNMRLERIDEAVRTRCFTVDVSMSKAQRVERMEAVLDKVMPAVDLNLKLEALALLKENLEAARSVNFRALMNVITIRNSAARDWKKLARFALIEN